MLVERGSDRLLICSLFNYLGYSVSVEPGIYRHRVRAKARSEKKEEAETLFLDYSPSSSSMHFYVPLIIGQ
eukprot:scaffold797_cov408-Chaetoceros_neogracile.AAC.64